MMTLENAATGEHCPNCNSEHTIYDSDHGFWQCEECSNVWAYDEDDPDYDDPVVLWDPIDGPITDSQLRQICEQVAEQMRGNDEP